jgi:ketosteroid isomerase-like protein
MKKLIIFLLFMNSVFILNAQTPAEKEILSILEGQTKSWNSGNLDEFMKGYWNNDSLIFVGKKSVTYGFQNALNNYKNGYPDSAAMGRLSFNILEVKKLSPKYYFVVGRWLLNRTAGDLQGHFTLVFRKIKGKWQIVSDHSS